MTDFTAYADGWPCAGDVILINEGNTAIRARFDYQEAREVAAAILAAADEAEQRAIAADEGRSVR